MSEPYEPEPSDPVSEFKLCYCGCEQQHHYEDGRCMYCFEDDCPGFEYDEEGTICALASAQDDARHLP